MQWIEVCNCYFFNSEKLAKAWPRMMVMEQLPQQLDLHD
jgi:hypothetical protein